MTLPAALNSTMRRILLFSDPAGLALIRDAAPWFRPAAIVAASIRPDQIADMKHEAARYNVPFLIQPKPAASDYAAFVRDATAIAPDCALINSYAMILRSDLLDALKVPVFNIHTAPLPEFRGANPVEWALIKDVPYSGVTLHVLDQGIDTGDIIAAKRTPIYFEDTWKDVRKRNARALTELLYEYLPRISTEVTISGVKQDPSSAQYFRRRTAEDGMLSWEAPLRQIHNMVRALSTPHPGTLLESPNNSERLTRYYTLQELAVLKQRALGSTIWESYGVLLKPRGEIHTVEPSWEMRTVESARLNFDALSGSKLLASVQLAMTWSVPVAPAQIIIPSSAQRRSDIAAALKQFCELELLRSAKE